MRSIHHGDIQKVHWHKGKNQSTQKKCRCNLTLRHYRDFFALISVCGMHKRHRKKSHKIRADSIEDHKVLDKIASEHCCKNILRGLRKPRFKKLIIKRTSNSKVKKESQHSPRNR